MNTKSILIVDDNPVTRKVVRATLESAGYGVIDVQDGRSALTLMAAQRVHLVLLDLQLPDVNGVELLPQLRALPGGADVPILAFTGDDLKLGRVRQGDGGFTAFLIKPVAPSRLLHTVRAHLSPRGAAQESPGAGRHVVLANDEPVQRKLLQVQLELAGFRITTADDGIEALEQARAAPPAAIVSDVLMPRLDGFKLCLAVRQEPHLAHVPVVLVSRAFTDETDQKLARECGANSLVLLTSDLRPVVAGLLAALSTPPPREPTVSVETLAEQYTQRLVQLHIESQAALNRELDEHVARLEAHQITIVGVARALADPSSAEIVLDEFLHRVLDTAGLSKGAAYLLEPDGRLTLHANLGFSSRMMASLPDFFGHLDVLRKVMAKGDRLNLSAAQSPEDWASGLLRYAEVTNMLIMPLSAGTEHLGVLVMASSRREVGDAWSSFVVTLGSQIGQAIALIRALADLRSNEEQLEVMAMAAPLVLTAIDRQGVIAKFTGGALATLGQHSADRLGLSIDVIFARHPDVIARARAALAGETLATTFEDGGRVFEERWTPQRGAGGAITGAVSVAVDVTEWARAQSAAEQARAAAEELARLRSDFVGSVSHELRTPLTSIVGYGELLQHRWTQMEETRKRVLIDRLVDAAHREQRLVEDLLLLSQIDRETPRTYSRPCNLAMLAQRAADEVRGSFAQQQIELWGPRDVSVLADPDRMMQVLVNLMDNAAKYSPEGSPVQVSWDLEGVMVALRVRDLGPGVPEIGREALFTRFGRVPNSPIRAGRVGTGLGLFLSRSLAEAMGGDLDLELTGPAGSTFRLRLPIAGDTEPS
jgi:signal transduction histidine kinase/DNA-binding response OmpR family regulator